MGKHAAKSGAKSKHGTRGAGTARATKRSAGSRARSRPAAATAKAMAGEGKSVQGVRSVLNFLKLPNIASALVAARKKDLQAILEANKKSYEGLQTVVQRQTAALRDALSEWQLAAKIMAASGPRESLSSLDKLAIASFRMALNNIRELAEMAVKSQAEAYEVVTTRIRENVDEVSKLLERE